MTFNQARAELKKLAAGRYYSIRYELIEYSSGRLEADCWVYIDSRISASAPNWKEALTKLRRIIKPESVNLSEMPKEELENKRDGREI